MAVKSWGRRLPAKWKTLALIGLVLCALVAAYLWFGRGTSGTAGGMHPERGPGGRPQPVSAGEVSQRDVRLWVAAIGNAIPRNLVVLRARVNGQLLRLNFKEGEMVKAGQLLAELDPLPYQALLTQANGQLARDAALLQNARLDLARYQELWAADSVSKQQLDTQEALVRQYQGTVENDQGIVDNAKLQLSYTRITAPVSGQISLRQVDPGNQVQTTDANGLASIAQLEPMTVVFSVPEIQLPEINRRLKNRQTLSTEAWDGEMKNLLASGQVLTADNQIDTTTGTIKLKAEFANPDHVLFPNQFVNVRLLLGVQKDALVVPSAAIMRGSKGTYVYVVDGEGTVKTVVVTTGAVDGNFTAISGELAAGDRVVVDGGDKLRDGIKVEVIVPSKGNAPRKAAGAAPAAAS